MTIPATVASSRHPSAPGTDQYGIPPLTNDFHLMDTVGDGCTTDRVLRSRLEPTARALKTAIDPRMELLPIVVWMQKPFLEILNPVATVIV
jgi:hypothetical protein